MFGIIGDDWSYQSFINNNFSPSSNFSTVSYLCVKCIKGSNIRKVVILCRTSSTMLLVGSLLLPKYVDSATTLLLSFLDQISKFYNSFQTHEILSLHAVCTD